MAESEPAHNYKEDQSNMFSARDINNAKGFLLELQAKNQTIIRVPSFSTFQQSSPLPAGFVCTLTVQKVSGNDPPLVLSSEPFPTKKVAEQDAARKMLLDVAFAQLFSQATKAVTSLLPAGLPMAIVDDAVLAHLRPVCASKVVCHDLQTGMPPESEGNVIPDGLSRKADCNGQIAQVRMLYIPRFIYLLTFCCNFSGTEREGKTLGICDEEPQTEH